MRALYNANIRLHDNTKNQLEASHTILKSSSHNFIHKISVLQLKLSNIKKTDKLNVNSLVKPEGTKNSHTKMEDSQDGI